MRIALYYPWVYLTSGAERTLLELTGRSRHEWTIFTSHYDPAHTFPGFAQRNVVEVGRAGVKRSIGAVGQAAWQILNLKLPLENYDALVVMCEGLGDLVLFRNSSRPALCICLTPLRVVFDEDYRKKWFEKTSLAGRGALTLASSLFASIDRIAWKRYRRIFCISSEAKRRAVKGRLGTEESLEVLHVGLGHEPQTPSTRFDRYFLLPGRIMWTKNIELGIEAFLKFRTSRPEFADFRLIIAGIVDEKSKPYLAKLREMAGTGQGIEFRIFPPDEEFAELYRNCYSVLFTAFNEDWGIVPLEGMAFGKPVIAVDRGGPKESVVHGVTGLLAPPEPAQFAEYMELLAGDAALTERMGRAGNAHCRRFSWDRFTDRIDDELENIAQVAEAAGSKNLAGSATRG
ncbi:MAG: glycosyltransferase [Terriglobia bacterium]